MKKSIRLIINTLADNYRSFDIEYLRELARAQLAKWYGEQIDENLSALP